MYVIQSKLPNMLALFNVNDWSFETCDFYHQIRTSKMDKINGFSSHLYEIRLLKALV